MAKSQLRDSEEGHCRQYTQVQSLDPNRNEMEKANIYVAKHKMVDMIDCNTFKSNIGEIVLTVWI